MLASIVIPSLNEEAYLPGLLTSISQQAFSDYEIILADAGSTDRTRQIAQEYGVKIIPGGMPAVGRNAGARVAKGDFLLFLDSDVTLPEDFLNLAFDEIEKKFYDLATCEMIADSQLAIDKAIYKTFNMLMKLNAYSNPMAAGSCIFITRRLFNRIGGFDEEIKIAEDFNLSKRAARFRPLEILESTRINISVRRLIKEGRLTFVSKAIVIAFYRTFVGEIRDDTFEYEFANFEEQNDEHFEKHLRKIDQLLIDTELNYRKFRSDIETKKENFKESIKTQLLGAREQLKDQLYNEKKKSKP